MNIRGVLFQDGQHIRLSLGRHVFDVVQQNGTGKVRIRRVSGQSRQGGHQLRKPEIIAEAAAVKGQKPLSRRRLSR